MNETALKNNIRTLLDSCNVMSLATSLEQTPSAAAVFFVADQNYSLYFISAESSQHSLNAKANPVVAATVNKDHDDWLTITGLQIKGVVSKVPIDDKREILELYLGKFASIDRLHSNPNTDQEKKIANRIMASPFYQLRPTRIKLIDNRQGFGTKMELDF